MNAEQLPATRDRRQRILSELRLSIVDRCNYRCPYCMPADQIDEKRDFLAPSARMSADEIETLVRAFVSLGVSKLRLTGGEPLLSKDLPELIERLAAIAEIEDLALTTNGSLLAAQAGRLRQAGLHRLTVSVDSLDPDQFARLSGERGRLSEVLAGIEAAVAAGFSPLRINCVVQRGVNDDQVLPLVEHFRGTPHVLRFIEFMDVGTLNGWSPQAVVSAAELRAMIGDRYPMLPIQRGTAGTTASRYRLVDGSAEIGFVASVSEPFCSDCGRARVAADGQLYTCLFASRSVDLLGPMRAGENQAAIAARIAAVWQQREDRYSELRGGRLGLPLPVKVQMYTVGG